MKGLHQGERLLLLVNRSGMSKIEVAQQLNINPGHLSRLFKSEILTTKIKKASCALFNVDMAFFDFSELEITDSQAEKESFDKLKNLEDISAIEVMRYLEEKDKRHYEERVRLLGIIENLTKK